MTGSIGFQDAEAMRFAAGQVTDLDEVPEPLQITIAHVLLAVADELARGRSLRSTVHEAALHLTQAIDEVDVAGVPRLPGAGA